MKGENERHGGLYKYPNMILLPSNNSKFKNNLSTRAEILFSLFVSVSLIPTALPVTG